MVAPRRKRGLKPVGLKEALERVPWASRGRETPISRLAKSIVPVGNKAGVPKGDLTLYVEIQDPAHEDWLMDIQGTAFQVGRGKLFTCWHVIEELRFKGNEAYLLANSRLNGVEAQRPYPFSAVMRYYDQRFADGGPGIDAGILICPATESKDAPYDVPPVGWGDSTRMGVGDRVLIGGFCSARRCSSRTRRTVAWCSRPSSRALSARSSPLCSAARRGCSR